MNYKIFCPECKKKVKVSTHEAVKTIEPFEDSHRITLTFGCPKCNSSIEGILINMKKEA